MAGPSVPVFTSTNPDNGDVFAPTTPPKYQVTCKSATNVYLRIWTTQGRLIAVRSMTNTTGTTWEYQLGQVGTINEVKRWTFDASINGGYFAFQYHDVNTDRIPWPFTADRIAQTIGNHPDFTSADNVSVAWNSTTRQLTVTFQHGRGGLDMDAMSIVNNLTGTTPTVTGSTVTSGNGDFKSEGGGLSEYKVDAVGSDGTYYSGGFAVGNLRRVQVSEFRTFWLDSTPVVTFTTPTVNTTVTVTLTQVPFKWSVSSQLPVVWQQIALVNDLTNETIDLDSSGRLTYWQTDDAESADTTTSYTLPYNLMENGQTYRWSHRARSQSGLTSFVTGKIKLVFTPPATLTTATCVLGGPSAGSQRVWLDMTWPQSTDSQFKDYVVRVRPLGARYVSSANIPIWQETVKTNLSARILAHSFSTDQVVSIVQRAYRTDDVIESVPKEFTFTAAQTTVTGLVLSQLTPPRNILELNAHAGRDMGAADRGQQWVYNWGDQDATLSYVPGVRRQFSATLTLDADSVTANAIYELALALYSNARREPLLLRDELGQNMTIMLDEPSLSIPGGGKFYQLSLSGRKVKSIPFSLED